MNKKLLLCTNSLLTHETVRKPLRSAGWEILSVSSGREAVGLCARVPFALLLVELDWPSGEGLDGCDVAREAMDHHPSVPIIVISGREDLVSTAEGLGVAAVVGRPIDVPALVGLADEVAAEAAYSRTNDGGTPECRHLPPNREAFRQALWERANAPFQLTGQPREYGLNE
jgi:DNA-binding response OmpR family regulator